MAICNFCKRKIKELPFHCHRCSKIYCSKHHLPEDHNCHGLEKEKNKNPERWKKAFESSFQRNEEREDDIVQSRKANPLKKLYYKFRYWLTGREHQAYKYSRFNSYVFPLLIKFIVSLIAVIVIYSNLTKLNEINSWIIKLGSTLLLVSLFFLIKYSIKLLSEIWNLINRQKNWLKYLIIILFLILLWQIYVNREIVLNPLFNYYNNTDLKEIYFPFQIEEGKNFVSDVKEGINEVTREDPEKYKTNPKTVKLPHVGDFVVYGGVNDYISNLDRSMSYYYVPPTTKDFILRDLNNDVQRAYLNPLVDKIKSKSDNSNEQARIVINMAQGIPYDWDAFTSGSVTGRYPYEVLYDMRGVCMEKADLMAFLLRELGFGVAIFEFEAENHRAVGIKCNNGNYNSNYCFVEPSDYYPIGQIPYDYVGGANIRSATPEIVIISDGKTYS